MKSSHVSYLHERTFFPVTRMITTNAEAGGVMPGRRLPKLSLPLVPPSGPITPKHESTLTGKKKKHKNLTSQQMLGASNKWTMVPVWSVQEEGKKKSRLNIL